MKKKWFKWGESSCIKQKHWLVMKLCLMLMVAFSLSLSANVYSQRERVSLNVKNAPLEEVISQIKKDSGVSFLYSVENLTGKKVSVSVSDMEIDKVLEKVLKETGLMFKKVRGVFVIQPSALLDKETDKEEKKKKTVLGSVVDNAGNPLPGVSVYIQGTCMGVVTDVKGDFKIEVPFEVNNLVFSFVGKETKNMKIIEGKKMIVKLSDEVSDLDEVTVVAYGERKKRELISSISSVKAEDIKEVPSASIENVLQGHMAGVEVSNISGSPGGGGTQVRIRGYNSLLTESSGDGSPLYVIDGVPVHSFTSPVTGTNTLAEIDPSTIESVEVLKDAASAALYGSRASNGVILITTKNGRVGKGKLTANVSYSYSILPETPVQTGGHLERLANIYKARNMRYAYGDWRTGIYTQPESHRDAYLTNGAYDYFWNCGVINPNLGVPRVLQDSLNPFYNNSTNWWKYCFKAGKIVNANIQSSGGTELIKYMVGAGWYKEEGIMYGSDFSRANILSNLNVTPRKNLSLDARLYLAYTDRSKGAANTSFSGASKIEGLTVDPKSNSSLLPGSGAIEKETLKRINETLEKNTSLRIRASLGLKYELIKGLNFSSNLSLDYNQGKSNSFSPSYLDKDLLSISTGKVNSFSMFLNENLLSYNFTAKDCHNFDFLLGMSYLSESNDNIMGSGRGAPSDKIHYAPVGFPDLKEISGRIEAMQSYLSGAEEKTMLSYFGRAAYNFNKKYLFEFTVRRDGSSVFGEDVRWATFPSVAVGWAFSSEEWMKNFWWLSYGKLRASWGTSGQQFSDPYLAHGLLDIGNTFLGNTGMYPTQMLNRVLTWEESDQYDVGLDLDLLDYRLKFKLDYYYKYSKSLLYNVELPGDVYYHNKGLQNAMEISNEGLELEVMYDFLRDTEVKWRGKFNISRNWNRFEKSYTNMDIADLVVGRPIFGLYLYKDLGYIQNEKDIPVYYSNDGTKNYLYSISKDHPFTVGSRLIKDMDADGKISLEDKYYAGSTLPIAYGGIANEIKWKGLDINVLFTYSLGRKIINLYKVQSMNFNKRFEPIYLDYANSSFWQQPGDMTDFPSIQVSEQSYYGQFGGDVSSNMETVNYVRFKQLTVGYNLPKSVLKKINIEGVKIFFTAENLLLWSNYSGVDPEAVSPQTGADNFQNYPLARKMSLGLTLKF